MSTLKFSSWQDLNGDTIYDAGTLGAIGTWQDFTPNFRPETGTWTSGVLYVARYTKINDTVIGFAHYQIANAGTGGGEVYFDVPVTAAYGSTSSIGGGREASLTGFTFNARMVNTATAGIRDYANGSLANGAYNFPCFFMYEAA